MGIEHPYLAILALIGFVAGVTGAIYLYINIYTETLRAPVLSAYTVACNHTNGSAIRMAITARLERGEQVALQSIKITSDRGVITLDAAPGCRSFLGSEVCIRFVDFDGVLRPGQVGRIAINISLGSPEQLFTKGATGRYHAILLFDKSTIVTSFTIPSCEELASSMPEISWLLLYATVRPVEAPIVFASGTNAGKPDIGSEKVIQVSIGNNATSVSVEVHPTYQWTNYSDIVRVLNTVGKSFNVSLLIENLNIALPDGSIVVLRVRGAGRSPLDIDLSRYVRGSEVPLGIIGGGELWILDLRVYIPEGRSIRNSFCSFKLRLAYTPL